jgi:alpha-N-arabinofuranosidase
MAQSPKPDPAAPIQANLVIHPDQPGPLINRNIYGQFAEHLGRCIYEGVWVGEDSPIPNTRGIRNDVVAALKDLDVPVVRWPGGCFADEYHWRDGIGPRDQRAKRVNTHWGGVIETNQFGTHEFLDFCEQINAQPYICGNVGSGTPQEMMDWVEYITSDSASTLANERRKNGREKPWKLPYFGVGNESWGCGGDMRPEFYADNYRRYRTFVKNYSGNHISTIACGSNGTDYNWTEILMDMAGRKMNGLSLHWYSLATGNWTRKGSALNFGEDQWHSILRQTLKMDALITEHSQIMDRYDPGKKVGLVVDEWGTWYDVDSGNPGFLYQQNTLRDAIAAGINLNIFNRHADRVTMANIAQMVNVLQAMILTDKEKMILTPTYWVFEMYKLHQGATLIPVDLTAPTYRFGDESIPSLSVSASRAPNGLIHVSLVNLDPNRPADVMVSMPVGAGIASMKGQILTASAMNAHNTFDQPDAVKPVEFTGVEMLPGGTVIVPTTARLHVPAKSIVVLQIQ